MNTGLIPPFHNSVLLVGITTSFPQSIALEHCLISLPEEEEVEERNRRENGRRGKGRMRNMEILFNKAIAPFEEKTTLAYSSEKKYIKNGIKGRLYRCV